MFSTRDLLLFSRDGRSLIQKLGYPEAAWRANSLAFTDSGTTLAGDNEALAQWNDWTGRGHNVTESTNKPTLQTNEFNSLPIVRFDGANDIMKTSSVISTGDVTLMCVVRLNAVPTASIGTVMTQEAVGGTPINGRINFTQNASTLAAAWRNDANSTATVITTTESFLGQWITVVLTVVGTTLTLYVNGSQRGQATTAGGAVTPTSLAFGGRPNATGYCNMDLAEAMVWKRGIV